QLMSYNLKAEYSYLTVPKIDRNAFLVGKITDWGRLNLLPGEANLIVGNNYAGTSMINPQATNDTLSLSLGRDNRVITERVLVDEQGSNSFLGSNQRRNFNYEITVRNNRSEA